MDGKYYLWVGRASDLENTQERRLYRFFEVIPGGLAWLTFALIFLVSWRWPVAAAFFIIAFDVYWLLRAIYFSFHLRASFSRMREYQKINWLQRLRQLSPTSYKLRTKSWEDIYHLVVIPFYKESRQVIADTLNGIKNSGYPLDRLIVVLSAEERRGSEGQEIGELAKKELGSTFAHFLFTTHPDAIPGELAGKGANETWAAKETKRLIIDPQNIPYENIITSVFDADTVVFPGYFARLAYAYLTAEKPSRTSFQPVPFFFNNIWEAPAPARVKAFSSTFWHLMNQVRPERLVSFSSHSFPFKALVEIGFWQTNVVNEDSRIFWQGLLAFDGDWRTEPLFFPVSMDANVAETFWKTVRNLYLQQRRWAYGCENIPYFLFGFIKNKKIALKAKLYWIFHMIEGFWSWATNSIIIFVLGWLPLFIGGDRFRGTILAYNLPELTSWVLTFSMIGIISSAHLAIILLPPRPPHYGPFRYFWMIIQWFLLPGLFLLGALPAIDAETRLALGKYMGFWPTPKVRKGTEYNTNPRMTY